MGSCDNQHDRRTFLHGVGPLLLGLGLAGCTTPGGGDGDDGRDSENDEGVKGKRVKRKRAKTKEKTRTFADYGENISVVIETIEELDESVDE